MIHLLADSSLAGLSLTGSHPTDSSLAGSSLAGSLLAHFEDPEEEIGIAEQNYQSAGLWGIITH